MGDPPNRHALDAPVVNYSPISRWYSAQACCFIPGVARVSRLGISLLAVISARILWLMILFR